VQGARTSRKSPQSRRCRTDSGARLHAEIDRLVMFLFPGMLSGLGLALAIAKLT
jgi:hypothetical protein